MTFVPGDRLLNTVLTARQLYTPFDVIDRPILEIEDGRIIRVASRGDSELPRNARVVNFDDAILAPGYIDIHIHGGAGFDVMRATPDELAAFERHLLKHGVTSYLPTTVTAPMDFTIQALDRLATAVETSKSQNAGDRARPLGIHLEGPFISHAKRGVHPPANLLEPSVKLLDQFWQASRGTVSVMTIAPELPGAVETIAAAAARGICVSLGHSNATWQEANAGVNAGARHATHSFNAMRPLDHREPGILGSVLADQRLTADIIADGIHVHPEAVKLFLKAKGPEGAVLITDAISATGMGDGRFRLGEFEVEVKGDRCEYEGKLAGSVLTLDRAVRNVAKFADLPLAEALRLATANPARALGASRPKGTLEIGADADLVVLSNQGEVIKTMVGGAMR